MELKGHLKFWAYTIISVMIYGFDHFEILKFMERRHGEGEKKGVGWGDSSVSVR